MQKKSFYDELKYDDLITVRCAFSIEEDESTIEAMMKELVDDAGRMDKEELTALRLRLLNTKSDTKAYRTFVVSHRDPDGDLCGRTKHLHRLDQHGQLLTVGSRTKLQRESRYDPTQFRFHMWEEPQPYQKASASLDVAPPRSVERVELSKTSKHYAPREEATGKSSATDTVVHQRLREEPDEDPPDYECKSYYECTSKQGTH